MRGEVKGVYTLEKRRLRARAMYTSAPRPSKVHEIDVHETGRTDGGFFRYIPQQRFSEHRD